MREALMPGLRAAGFVAFVAGVAAVLLNPPSLNGAEDLLTLVLGAVAVIAFTAWATVRLGGYGDPRSEREFERLVRRSERLARRPRDAVAETEFELLVADAIDALPQEFRTLLDDTPVVVSELGASEHAYGHYFGGTVARPQLERRIVLYRDTLERDFGHDPELLRAQVERTLRHELAHHIGWNERGVRELGL